MQSAADGTLDVAEILTCETIDYVVIGDFGLVAHAVVRALSVVNALLHVSYSRLATISTMFEAAHFEVTLRRGNADDSILSMLILSDTYGN